MSNCGLPVSFLSGSKRKQKSLEGNNLNQVAWRRFRKNQRGIKKQNKTNKEKKKEIYSQFFRGTGGGGANLRLIPGHLFACH